MISLHLSKNQKKKRISLWLLFDCGLLSRGWLLRLRLLSISFLCVMVTNKLQYLTYLIDIVTLLNTIVAIFKTRKMRVSRLSHSKFQDSNMTWSRRWAKGMKWLLRKEFGRERGWNWRHHRKNWWVEVIVRWKWGDKKNYNFWKWGT